MKMRLTIFSANCRITKHNDRHKKNVPGIPRDVSLFQLICYFTVIVTGMVFNPLSVRIIRL